MRQHKCGCAHVLLGAFVAAAFFATVAWGLILAGAKDRSGRTLDVRAVPFLAAFGALIGGVNSWRAGRVAIFGPGQRQRGMARFLGELADASRGAPDEKKAARTVATAAVIPATIGGILAGTLLVDETEPGERLLWVCTATAFAAGFATVTLVWVVYRVFGFRPIVVLARTLWGGFCGFALGAALGKAFDAWWPWLLGPLGIVLGLLLSRTSRAAESDAAAHGPSSPSGQPPIPTESVNAES